MAFTSTGENAKYCQSAAKLTSQPLTEVFLYANAAADPEICIRLGETKEQFNKLARAWRHSLCIPRKNPYLKLLYCLHAMWLNKAHLRKIDGFQTKHLRSILCIPPIYIRRISIVTVLQRSCCKHLSAILKVT